MKAARADLTLDRCDSPPPFSAASCSSRITAEAFRTVFEESVRAAGRRADVLEQTGHPVDHPIGFPEGAYLKCIYARVD